MEVKFRYKGEIVTGEFKNIPREISPPEGLRGIDLTGVRVFFVRGGKLGYKKAEGVFRANPGVVVAYSWEWRNGYGSGILLPTSFNLSRVKFYLTQEQLDEKKKEAAREAAENLMAEVEARIPNVKVSLNFNRDGVQVGPLQEVFCLEWEAEAHSLEEAEKGVEQRVAMWREWNERGLEAWKKYNPGQKIPGRGNIQLTPSPRRGRVGINVGWGAQRWVLFEKEGDGWVEKGEHCYPPS